MLSGCCTPADTLPIPCPALACSNTRVTDSCLTDLEQLSLLAQLDLTGSHIAFSPSEGDVLCPAAALHTPKSRHTMPSTATWHAKPTCFPCLVCWLLCPHTGQRQLGSLTSLRLNPSLLDDRGCRHLAAAAWQLRWLWLGSKAVQDKGLKALCALPKVEQQQGGLHLCI